MVQAQEKEQGESERTASQREALSKRSFPWERQPGESIQAYRRFMAYRLTPPAERSYRKLDVHFSLAARWAKRWQWVKRTAEYDEYVSESIDGLSNQAQIGARYRAARLGSAFVRHTEGQLSKVKLNTVDDLVNLAKAGVSIERQALMLTEATGDTRADRAPVAQVAVSFGSAPPWLAGQITDGGVKENEVKQNETLVQCGEQVIARPPLIASRARLTERKVNCPKGNPHK